MVEKTAYCCPQVDTWKFGSFRFFLVMPYMCSFDCRLHFSVGKQPYNRTGFISWASYSFSSIGVYCPEASSWLPCQVLVLLSIAPTLHNKNPYCFCYPVSEINTKDTTLSFLLHWFVKLEIF